MNSTLVSENKLKISKYNKEMKEDISRLLKEVAADRKSNERKSLVSSIKDNSPTSFYNGDEINRKQVPEIE